MAISGVCRRGHQRPLTERGQCRECKAQKTKEWAEANKGRARLIARRAKKKFYEGHIDECRRKARDAYRSKDRPKKAKPEPVNSLFPVVGRVDAIAAGLARYYTGLPCKSGHDSERFISGKCCACGVLKDENRDAYNAWNRGYRKKNRARVDAYARTTRARRAQSCGSHTAADIDDIRKAQKRRCAYCKISFAATGETVDHIKPLARGGSNFRANIQLLCAPCNRKKNAADPVDYARKIGLLI